jgi:hypothetical protein
MALVGPSLGANVRWITSMNPDLLSMIRRQGPTSPPQRERCQTGTGWNDKRGPEE